MFTLIWALSAFFTHLSWHNIIFGIYLFVLLKLSSKVIKIIRLLLATVSCQWLFIAQMYTIINLDMIFLVIIFLTSILRIIMITFTGKTLVLSSSCSWLFPTIIPCLTQFFPLIDTFFLLIHYLRFSPTINCSFWIYLSDLKTSRSSIRLLIIFFSRCILIYNTIIIHWHWRIDFNFKIGLISKRRLHTFIVTVTKFREIHIAFLIFWFLIC